MLDLDWTIVAAIAFAIFMMGRLSVSHRGEIIAEYRMNPAQKNAYATVCDLRTIRREFGKYAPLTKLWLDKRFELPPGFQDPSDLLLPVDTLVKQIEETYRLRCKPEPATV